ncbi:MAG TPA: YjgN family protein [bacterium]|nr:YjgN family protein [bacterium]
MSDTTMSPATAAPVVNPLPPGGQSPFVHHGRTRELLGICAVNLLLKVVTLGAYHFWGKSRVRRYVWSHTLFAGEAFEYTGRGKELALGYAVAMLVLVPLIVLLNLLPLLAERAPWLVIAVSLGVYPLFAFLAGVGMFGARRYLLSRTRWRSIRFALTGRARAHGGLTLLYGLLSMITFGLYVPFMRNRLAAHLIGNAWFGSERFRYDGADDVLLHRYLRAGALMVGVLVAWVALLALGMPLLAGFLRGAQAERLGALLPAVIGVVVMLLVFPAMGGAWLWYRAGELRHFVAHTRLGDARFALELSNRRYIWLYLSNLGALVGTLGLAYPWVVVRTARTLTTHLRMDGVLELGAIEQSSIPTPRTGEGLFDALDLGSI